MHLGKQNFHEQAFTEFPTYMADNAWFGFKLDNDDPKGPKRSIGLSWLAYEKTGGATAGSLILGDTKLRSDEDLVMNFGLSSADGVQEEESRRMVEDIMNKRKDIAAGTSSAAPSASSSSAASRFSPPPPPLPVVGSGSILSTRGWSPMLNDSFIMGGVHAGHQFHVALNNDETGVFARTRNSGLAVRDNWRLFLRANPRMLWDGERGLPRVLMREFICLEASDYEPNFEHDQLIFKCKKGGSADKAGFRVYLKALHDAGFQTPTESKGGLVKEIAKFLFDDEKALDGAL